MAFTRVRRGDTTAAAAERQTRNPVRHPTVEAQALDPGRTALARPAQPVEPAYAAGYAAPRRPPLVGLRVDVLRVAVVDAADAGARRNRPRRTLARLTRLRVGGGHRAG